MGLQPIVHLLALAYYRWASANVDPFHPDLPHSAVRLHELSEC
jgi:hypothetical protein